LAWYDENIFNDSPASALPADTGPSRVQTNEIENLMQRLGATDVEHVTVSAPTLPLQPLPAAPPSESGLIPDGISPLSSEPGPSCTTEVVIDKIATCTAPKVNKEVTGEEMPRYPSKVRRVSRRKVKGAI
jgi:hypothetical protein